MKNQLIYDGCTDTMFFGNPESRYSDEEEIAPGVHLMRSSENGNLESIEIEYFTERLGIKSFKMDLDILKPRKTEGETEMNENKFDEDRYKLYHRAEDWLRTAKHSRASKDEDGELLALGYLKSIVKKLEKSVYDD